MKTASISSLRVNPELWHAAESVLEEGESLSHFVEQSLRANIERSKMQCDFICRGRSARILKGTRALRSRQTTANPCPPRH